MKKIIIIALLLQVFISKAQDNIVIELPEVYELSNIVLALTSYGIEDKWEVQKRTTYYKEIQEFFSPVKNHPLLDSVNYSRARWEDYLSFRTDAYAFSFGKDGQLKRNIPFSSVEDHLPFDKHLVLINDFVQKSNFRQFYKDHLPFYTTLMNNYKQYYYIDKMKLFLDKAFQRKASKSAASETYKIIVSPLVGRMNCHRNIDSLTSADFPNLSVELISGSFTENSKSRIVESHTIFTEMDHGYVNPLSDKYNKLILESFDTLYWDRKSGYGLSSFNEYMTWALYDIFVKENFPQSADSIALQWHYQNASRGFIASNVFADKVKELYAKHKNIEQVYAPLLKWSKAFQKNIKQSAVWKIKEDEVWTATENGIEVKFTEPLQSVDLFDIRAFEVVDGKETGNSKTLSVNKSHHIIWSKDKKQLNFKLDVGYKNYHVIFNWWGISKPLMDRNGILLKPLSYITVETK
jgi:hypothetical protein